MLKPEDCHFLFGLPISKKDFEMDKINIQKHFVREHLTSLKIGLDNDQLFKWYKKEVLQPYIMFKNQFIKYGFSFSEQPNFDSFSQYLSEFRVNIIFSHNREKPSEAIEFWDKLVEVDEFLKTVPIDYDKVIDLSVCRPIELARKLEIHRKKCIVKSSNKPVSFIYWFYFYSILFEIIATKAVTYYSDAIELAVKKLSNL